MKKFIPEKSAPTVAVSMPKSGNEGGFVAFLHEKAGSFSMACSLLKEKKYADIKIEASKPKPKNDTQIKNKSKNGQDTIDEEEAGPSESAAQGSAIDGVQAKSGGSRSFEDDEEKMDKLHEESKRRYGTQKKGELLRIDRELDILNGEIEELVRKEKEDIKTMEGLMKEIERRKEECDQRKWKALDEVWSSVW